MNDTVIEIKGLGKKYRIESRQSYSALRDMISEKARGMFRKERISREEFWALQDIDLDVHAGETLGIIGRNGAGKSTLLKLISRITEPTTGRIRINGRVASLLEVGTGFHPELTGRENIFLNGAILGMRRAEVKKKFDEIVDFSGVEQFLDMPVKRYSSGMYLRLAFAVAAHLEPEILLVDEVLAVGDIEFQRKCLGKMQEVSKNEGRTVLFVSHNLEAIKNLCKNGIILTRGRLTGHGDIHKLVDQYLENREKNPVFEANEKGKPIYFQNISIATPVVKYGETLELNCEIGSVSGTEYTLGLSILNQFEKVVASTFVHSEAKLNPGANHVRVQLPLNSLVPGDYEFVLAICLGKSVIPEDVVTGFPSFKVTAGEENQDKFARWSNNWGDHILTNVVIGH